MPSVDSNSSTNAWARVQSFFASHHSAASGADSPFGGSSCTRGCFEFLAIHTGLPVISHLFSFHVERSSEYFKPQHTVAVNSKSTLMFWSSGHPTCNWR